MAQLSFYAQANSLTHPYEKNSRIFIVHAAAGRTK